MNTEFRELRKYKLVNRSCKVPKKCSGDKMAENELDVLVGDEAGPESQVRYSEPAFLYRTFSSRSRAWGT